MKRKSVFISKKPYYTFYKGLTNCNYLCFLSTQLTSKVNLIKVFAFFVNIQPRKRDTSAWCAGVRTNHWGSLPTLLRKKSWTSGDNTSNKSKNFLRKVEVDSTFCHIISQLATTSLVERRVGEVLANTRNNTHQLACNNVAQQVGQKCCCYFHSKLRNYKDSYTYL